MTQNMDAGTDLTFAILELLGVLSPGVGVDLTDPKEFGTDNQIETKIRNAAAALGIFV